MQGDDWADAVGRPPLDGPFALDDPNYFASLLRQAGFKVDLQAMDWQTLVGRRAKKDAPDKGGWNIFLTAWNVFDVWSPIANPTMDTRGEKSGWFGWASDDKMIEIRNQFMRATDEGVKP